MPGWIGSDRRDRLPADWSRIRKRILRRDGYQCVHLDPDSGERCTEHATDVDHIRPGDDHSETNLRSLCKWHHQKKSSHEGGVALAEMRRRNEAKFRRHEAHPGDL